MLAVPRRFKAGLIQAKQALSHCAEPPFPHSMEISISKSMVREKVKLHSSSSKQQPWDHLPPGLGRHLFKVDHFFCRRGFPLG